MTRTIHRFEVPVDGHQHEHQLHPGVITRVETVERPDPVDSWDVVEFWMEQWLDRPLIRGQFLVVGTGHPIGEGWAVSGSTARRDGPVCHLLSRFEPLPVGAP